MADTEHDEFAVEDLEGSEDITYTDNEDEGSLEEDERPPTPVASCGQSDFKYVDTAGEDINVSPVSPLGKIEPVEKPLANSDYFFVKDSNDNVYRAYLTLDQQRCIVLAKPDDDRKAVAAMSKQIQFTERLAKVSLDHIQKMLADKDSVPVVSKLWNLHFGKGLLLSSVLATRILSECREKRKAKAAKRKAAEPAAAADSGKRKKPEASGAPAAKKRKPAGARDKLAVIKEEPDVDAKPPVASKPLPTGRTMQITLSGVSVADIHKIAALFPEM